MGTLSQKTLDWQTELVSGLGLTATLADLPTHAYRVNVDVPTRVVDEAMRRQPELPGAIVTREGALAGVVSRRRCRESLSRVFGRDVFISRAICVLLEEIPVCPLVLDAETRIAEGAHAALSRPGSELYEPVVVRLPDGSLELLDNELLLVSLAHTLGLQNAEKEALLSRLRRRREQLETTLQRLRETQQNLVEAERLASLGELVAGIAHEINTPVGLVLTTASHLDDKLGELRKAFESASLRRTDLQSFFDIAAEANSLTLSNARRAAELVRQFRQLASDQRGKDRRRFKLRQYMNEVLHGLGPRLRRGGHTLEVVCSENLEVDSYPGALSQVLTNLVVNSLTHGFGERREGRIAIHVKEPADNEVELHYIDNGRGIPEAIRGRIFDPFFTTNRGGGGTGLGLNIAHNLVVGTLSGQITVTDGPQGGALFTILFPKIAPKTPSAAQPFINLATEPTAQPFSREDAQI